MELRGMLNPTRRKLERLQHLLDEMQGLLKEILQESESSAARLENRSAFDAGTFLNNIKAADRNSAKKLLSERNYRELGAIFIEAGGTSVDSKKPKDWLLDQILWRIFDFQRGHEAIRSRE